MSSNKKSSIDKPRQRLSYSEKIQNKNEWGKQVIEYYLKHASFYSEFGFSNGSKKDLALLYRVHNNDIPDEWFSSVVDPYNVKDPSHKNQPAPIRKTNIARPVIEKLLGEYTKRPFSWFVDKIGEEGYNRALDQLTSKLHENIKQHFINNLDPAIFQQAQENQQEVPMPEKVKESFDDSYLDAEAMTAQDLLTKVMEDVYFFEKSRAMIKDLIIAGEEYTLKDIRDDQIVYEKISPLDVWYIKSYYSPYIEDGEVAVTRKLLNYSEVVDMFYREITEDQLDKLGSATDTTLVSSFMYDLQKRNSGTSTLGKIPVYYVTWKSQRKIGFVSWTDEFGQEYEDVVSEDYVKNEERNEKIEWRWINEVWEGYKIGKEDYLRIRPLPFQRNELNNISKCKLPINGRCYSDDHAANISIYELMIEWVKLFIIVNYRLERMIAKSKDKILLLDKAVIPSDAEWDEEKFFYYADTLGFALIDRSQIGADRGFNQYSVLDMRLYEDIQQMIGLLDWIRQQCYDTVGFSQQRLGEISASETATNATNAAYASAVITEDLFIKHEEFIQRELQGLLDLSRLAYRDGYKTLVYSDDRRVKLLEINPEVHSYLDLAIKVTNNSKQVDRLNQMKQLIQPYLQNGGKMSSVIEVLDAENTSKIKHVLRKIERVEQEQLERQAQQEQESQQAHDQQMIQLQHEYAQIESMFRQQEINLEYDRKEGLEFIKGDIQRDIASMSNTETGTDVDNNGVPDINEREKRTVEREQLAEQKRDALAKDQLKREEIALKRKEVQDKARQAEQDLKMKKYSEDMKLRVAKAKPKPKPSSGKK